MLLRHPKVWSRPALFDLNRYLGLRFQQMGSPCTSSKREWSYKPVQTNHSVSQIKLSMWFHDHGPSWWSQVKYWTILWTITHLLRNEYAYSSLNLNQHLRELLHLRPIEPTFPVRFPLPELTAVQKCAPSPLGMDTWMAPWKFGWILECRLGEKKKGTKNGSSESNRRKRCFFRMPRWELQWK